MRDSEPELPLDSDIEVSDSTVSDSTVSGPRGRGGAPVAVHLRPRFLLLVALGGALGTALREAISLLLPPVSGIPVAIAAINVGGALALGVLLEVLSRAGSDIGRRRTTRLFVGTGVLGGFTTYSALANDTAGLLDDGRVGAALTYGLGTVVLGLLACFVGVVLGARVAPRRGARS